MTGDCPCPDEPLVRLFEKLSKWVGLSDSCAPALATLYAEKYRTNRTLCSGDICEATGYSRANAGLVISQLEAVGIVTGQRDLTQTGRGRKRVLYSVTPGLDEFFAMGVKSVASRMQAMLKDVGILEERYIGGDTRILDMLGDLRSQVETNLKALKELPAIETDSPS